MDKKRMDELAGDPRFISGIYNYCDRWCERCAFMSRCMNYALSEEEFGSLEAQGAGNGIFWSKLHEVFAAALERVKKKAKELGIDLDAVDLQEAAEQDARVHKAAKEQPYSQAAMKYKIMVDDWLRSNENLLEQKSAELEWLAQADIPRAKPVDDAASIHDCFEVIRWYQRQIYVKLCRAASGLIRNEGEALERAQEDANGSAKVALVGLERSLAAWAALLPHFPDQERSILSLLVALKRLLRQVEAAFPNARAFVRPGFDTDEK